MHPSWNEYPHLIAELDPDGNKDLTYLGKSIHVLELAAGTSKRLDWKCSICEHQWKSTGNNRIRKGCPACSNRALHSDGRNSMAVTHPELASEYQGDATTVIAGTGKKLPWKCRTCEHEWETTGDSRKNGCGCPACKNKAIHSDGRNSLLAEHPELAKECLEDPSKIISKTPRKIKWKCSTCDHVWKAKGHDRVSGQGCPFCNSGFLHSDGRNSMAATHPELAKEYQGDATQVIATTEKKLDWKCGTCGNEWKANSRNRVVHNSGCPKCADAQRILSFKKTNLLKKGSLLETHPDLAQELLNEDPSQIVAGVNKKLLWKCSTISDTPCGYEWYAMSSSRSGSGVGCPRCAKTGFKPNEPAYYYVHKILNNLGEIIMYKAGISKNWKQRLTRLRNKLPEHLTINNFEVINFEIGQEAQDLETTLLRMAAEEGWKAPPRDFDGGHELFLENPLDHARHKGLLSPKHK